MNPPGSRGTWMGTNKDHIPRNWLPVRATGTGNKRSRSDVAPWPFWRVWISPWIRYPAFFQACDPWPSSAARELFTERSDQFSQPRCSQASSSSSPPPPPAHSEDELEFQHCPGLMGIPIPDIPRGMFPILSLLSLPPLPVFLDKDGLELQTPRGLFPHVLPAFLEGCS